MRVIKIGGRVQSSPALGAALASGWHAAPGALCVIHGGGDAVSAVQRTMGVEPVFVDGRRVTGAADIEILRMVLSGLENKRLVATLTAQGIAAVGLSGEDGSLLVAEQETGALGLVGTPVRVNTALVRHLLAGGYLPVISPLSAGERSGAATLNVNGDDAAAAIAIALEADELLFVADVAGVLLDGEALPELTSANASDLIARGIARGGMAAKLRAALRALAAGVPAVRIGDLSAIGNAELGSRMVNSRSPARQSA